MEFTNLTSDELQQRMSEIEKEVTDLDINSEDFESRTQQFNEEVDQIKNELECRKKAEEERVANLTKIAKETTIIEKKEEKRKMNFEEIRNSQEYRSAWLQNLMNANLTEEQRNMLNETRAFSSSNTYAVPTAIADKVCEVLKQVCPLINEVELFRVNGNLRLPVESSVASASAHAENDSVTASADALTYIDLIANEVVKIVEVSKNALKQSESVFENWLVNALARKIADYCDYVICSGTYGLSSGTWTTNTNQILDTTGLSYANLCSLVALTPAYADGGAKFVLNKKTLWKIKGLKDSQNRPILDPNAKQILGYDYIVDDNITTTADLVYFGNLFEGIKANQGDIEIEANEGAGFYKAMVPYRGYTTFDAHKVGSTIIARFVTTA